MPHTEAQAWWADVQHVRETIERRRAGLADNSAPRDAGTETRFARRDEAPPATVDDLDRTQVAATRTAGRSDRPGRSSGGDLSTGAGVGHTTGSARAPRDRADAAARGRRPGADVADRASARRRWDDDHVDADARADRDRRTRRHPGAETRLRGDSELGGERLVGRGGDLTGGRGPRSGDDRRGGVDPRAGDDSRGGTRFRRTARSEPAATPLAAPASRRTVEITGRTVAAPPLPRLVEVERRRPPRRTVERVGPRPDRVALWAVLLGFFLILVAATSSRAATPVSHGHAGATVALHAPAR